MDERALLQCLLQGPVTGDMLAQAHGQTRAAAWKRIARLREAGVAISATPGRGYALTEPVELLEADAIRAALPTPAQAELAALEVAWSLDSSNSELLRRDTPPTGTTVLLAERQTGGRGRRGRTWVSPLAANLILSLARQFGGGLARLGGLSLVAGVAVAQALHALGYAEVGLKWPNDLVVAGRKLGGLLVEGGGEHGGPARAVVGLGLNIRMPASIATAIDQPWIDLAGLRGGEAPARNAVAAAVIGAVLPALARFDTEGLAPFLEAYAGFDVLRGHPVTVHAADGDHRGLARGLASDGALRVEIDGHERVFHAGETSVRA